VIEVGTAIVVVRLKDGREHTLGIGCILSADVKATVTADTEESVRAHVKRWWPTVEIVSVAMESAK
jgi:hypothetical protein